MSATPAVFHGSEIDDPKLLPGTPDGWYVGCFGGFAGVGNCVDPDSITGPYGSQEIACRAMVNGCWL